MVYYEKGRVFIDDQELKSGGTVKVVLEELLIGNTEENLQKLVSGMENNNEHEIGLALGY